MEIYIIGCGGTAPLPNRHLTSILIRRAGESFLFDCGEGSQVSLKKLNLGWKSISNIFISHTHADHVTGIPGIMMLSSQVSRERALQISGPSRIKDYINANREYLEMFINYELEINEISTPEQVNIVYDTPELSISSFPLYHSRPCVGYSILEKPRPGKFSTEKARQLKIKQGPLWGAIQAGEAVKNLDGLFIEPGQVMGPSRPGLKVCYVTDTCFTASIASHLHGADLLICEGMFKSELEEHARSKKHMTASQAAQLAVLAGEVKRLGLIHYSPRYNNKDLPELLGEAQAIFPNSFLCRDQMRIELAPKD